MKSIKLTDYFKLVKPEYAYIQIIPHKSIRNYNSSNIAKAIAHTYKSINKRVHKEQKKLFFETNFKISYMVDIVENNANFYFIVPKPFLSIIVEKIKEIWSKATITLLEEGVKPFSDKAETWELSYKKEDALSLFVDKKSNEPLNSILSVIDIMHETDRVCIIYNFIPQSQLGWIETYEETMEKLRLKKPVIKEVMSFEYIVKTGIGTLLSLLDSITRVIGDFIGAEDEEGNTSLYASIMGILEQQGELSASTKRKKEATIIKTEIAIISESDDNTRRDNNALSICQAFRVLDEDNELRYIKSKKKIDFEKADFELRKSLFSTDEISNFIQIPGRMLLNSFGINHIKTEETKIPAQLQKGYFELGESKYKGAKTKAYLEDEYNKGNLPLVLIGQQGSGKSEYIKNIAKYCINNKESIILLDFIKSCNLSNSIAGIVPEDRLVKIDLSSERDIQGLGYNEIKVLPNMSTFKKLDLASRQAQQIMNIVDAISVGDPLSSRMRRYLSSAAKVVLVQGYNSLKDVVNCLEDFRRRSYFIQSLSSDLISYLEDELNTLEELNEYSKPNKDNPVKEVIGTYSSKIEHILDRISMLREDFKLKFMYDKSCSNNIDLVECMEKGKIVLIQMREDDFPSKMIKNILVTYWVSKVWLASQVRGGTSEKPIRCNFIIDEIFQAPTSLNMMNYIIPQSRKFGLHTILSTQFINQLDSVFESLEASGSSFMLLRGANENDFNHFKSKFEGTFEYEDLRDMENFSSMNLINYSGGYATFITKLPSPIKE